MADESTSPLESDELPPESAAEDASPTIAATLYLKGVKTRSGVKVYGVSGRRYAFRWSDKHRAPVLHFESAEEFRRVEEDIRKVRQGQFVVCTLLGSTDPVTNAKEALETLIGASRRVPVPQRREALDSIRLRAEEALDELEAGQAEPDEPSPQVPDEQPEPVEAVPLPVGTWRETETGAPVPPPADPSQPVPVDEPAPVANHGGKYTQAQLMSMPMGELKALGASAGSNAKQRDALVAAVLKAQGA